MGRYQSYRVAEPEKKPWSVHPVWRGIGCILLVILPIISYSAAYLLVRENLKQKWVEVPAELAGSIDFSLVSRIFPALEPFFESLGPIFYLDLLITFLFVFFFFAIMTILYSLLFRAAGGSHYGPLDAPPVRKSPSRRPR
jgi:hypothetical protein